MLDRSQVFVSFTDAQDLYFIGFNLDVKWKIIQIDPVRGVENQQMPG